MRRNLAVTLVALFITTASAHGAIQLGDWIGVWPSGGGSDAVPWVYDYLGGNLDWGTDTAEQTTAGQPAFVSFTNIANVTSSGSGGTVHIEGPEPGLNAPMGSLSIDASGAVNIGGFLTVVNNDDRSSTDAGPISVTGPTSISIGANDLFDHPNDPDDWAIATWSKGNAGAVTLRSDGTIDVGGGINSQNGLPGSGTSDSNHDGGAVLIEGVTGGTKAGAVSIDGTIRTRGSRGFTAGGDVTINALSLTVDGDLDTRGTSGKTSDQSKGGDIIIQTTDNAWIKGNIDTRVIEYIHPSHGWKSLRAGNVVIESSDGSIDVDGGFDLRDESEDLVAEYGRLRLTALNGTITVGSLDLDKLFYVKFESGSDSTIEGELAGFVDGTDKLRAPDGQKVFYDENLAANTYLGGLTYDLVASDGVSDGGVLTPMPIPEPATAALLGLGGLLGLTGMLRRRMHAGGK
jgi:hypothetical protein